MAETFLILLAGGVMLAAAIENPDEVTIHWLRLAGIIALTLSGVAAFFLLTREGASSAARGALLATGVMILGQLGFVQAQWKQVQRALAAAAFAAAVATGTLVLGETRSAGAAAVTACAGIAAMAGLALMDMLLGHAYLTAAQMTIRPFLRLNRWLAATLILRVVSTTAVALMINAWNPVPRLVGIYGLWIGTRWLVGLLVPAVFVYMAHDCIKRRSTQSATGILYVAGVLIFIGEIIALHLVRETGLPF